MEQGTLNGRAFKFCDGISTDLIIAGKYAHLRSNLPELAKHAMEDVNPNFVKLVRPGDFIVAGCNFGLGSSREHAPLVIKMAGVSAILAKSFARIFFRNAINQGVPALICQTDGIAEGDCLEISLDEGLIRNITKNESYSFTKIPPTMLSILNEGGLIPYINKHGDLKL
ncbi:MAG: 3-isopropylmalate dehydratase small subunit [Chloroflexi bacterium]|nr:3-isopropylmalate dehydratase small subunit [Chloroflexota bacterium]